MRFLPFLPVGLNRQFTPTIFAVPGVEPRLAKPKQFGLTADRLSTPKTIGANGRSFTTASARRPGGLGVVIGLRQRLGWEGRREERGGRSRGNAPTRLGSLTFR